VAFNLAAALSLLLCLTTLALWLRSGWRTEYVQYCARAVDGRRSQPPAYARVFKAGSCDGVLWLEWWPAERMFAEPWYTPGWSYGTEPGGGSGLRGLIVPDGDWWAWNKPWAFAVTSGFPPIEGTFRVSWLAYVLAFAILPTVWLLRYRRKRRRRRLGLCDACGYDLRESPERCPECGAMKPARWRVAALAEPSAGKLTSS
jgi:uncharacterized membrane protein